MQSSPITITDDGLLKFGTGTNDMAMKAVTGSGRVSFRDATDAGYRGIAVSAVQIFDEDLNIWASGDGYGMWGASVSNHAQLARGKQVRWTTSASYNDGEWRHSILWSDAPFQNAPSYPCRRSRPS